MGLEAVGQSHPFLCAALIAQTSASIGPELSPSEQEVLRERFQAVADALEPQIRAAIQAWIP